MLLAMGTPLFHAERCLISPASLRTGFFTWRIINGWCMKFVLDFMQVWQTWHIKYWTINAVSKKNCINVSNGERLITGARRKQHWNVRSIVNLPCFFCKKNDNTKHSSHLFDFSSGIVKNKEPIPEEQEVKNSKSWSVKADNQEINQTDCCWQSKCQALDIGQPPSQTCNKTI